MPLTIRLNFFPALSNIEAKAALKKLCRQAAVGPGFKAQDTESGAQRHIVTFDRGRNGRIREHFGKQIKTVAIATHRGARPTNVRLRVLTRGNYLAENALELQSSGRRQAQEAK